MNAADRSKLAEKIFDGVLPSPAFLEEKYPPRSLPEGAAVTRFAPSPTGNLHIGGLFGAFTDKLYALRTGGVFLLRLEDTDKKREVEDGVSGIVEGLAQFGVVADEGVTGCGSETGAYGPYVQSRRKEIYHVCAKYMVEAGLAYPCFCTEEDLNTLRAEQEQSGVNKGYYGAWAKCRALPPEDQLRRIEAGEAYTLRLRAPEDEGRKFTIVDQVRGRLELPQNTMDIVILKSDGIPTYHFAHAVDDHFMRVTHVIRGDEWLASLPLHVQLFELLGFQLPRYAHTASVMKEDNGSKRKLSKRYDPEAAVRFYAQQGYPCEAVQEYLLTLLNSNFEDWRRANPLLPLAEFPFSLKKLSPSGALFDLIKLEDVSKTVIARMTARQVYEHAAAWAKEYDAALYALLSADPCFAQAMFAIDRGGKKPRKDIAKWSLVRETYSYFYDVLFAPQKSGAAEVLQAYLAVYDPADEKDVWFTKIKSICEPLGYCPDVKAYKAAPESFKGHVGDVSGFIRLAVTGRENTPDLWAILRVLGKERVQQRLKAAIAAEQINVGECQL